MENGKTNGKRHKDRRVPTIGYGRFTARVYRNVDRAGKAYLSIYIYLGDQSKENRLRLYASDVSALAPFAKELIQHLLSTSPSGVRFLDLDVVDRSVLEEQFQQLELAFPDPWQAESAATSALDSEKSNSASATISEPSSEKSESVVAATSKPDSEADGGPADIQDTSSDGVFEEDAFGRIVAE